MVQFHISDIHVQSCNHYNRVKHINNPPLVASPIWKNFSVTAANQCDDALQANLTEAA